MKKKTKRLAAEVGAGVVTAAALAVAATYFLGNSKMAKKGKARAKAWVAQARREVLRNVRAARRVSQADYMRLADMAAKRYGSMQHANAGEIMAAAREMKAEWKKIRNHAEKIAKNAERSAKRMAPKRKAHGRKATKRRNTKRRR